MAGMSLHKFDLKLCQYVWFNVVNHTSHSADSPLRNSSVFSRWISSRLGPQLKRYVFSENAPDKLLNDDDLRDLALAVDGDLEVLRRWEADERVYRWHSATLLDVQSTLSPQVAADWSRACAGFARKLSQRSLLLPDGIKIIHDWLQRLRGLLKDMNEVNLLPCPEGKKPTPTCSKQQVKTDNPNEPPMDIKTTVEKLRKAIRDTKGSGGKPMKIITVAHVNASVGRKGLRWLESRGENHGFTRPPPAADV